MHHVFAHGTTDDVEGGSRIVIEVAEIVGNGEHEEDALGVGVAQKNGIARHSARKRPTGTYHFPGHYCHLK